MPRLTVVIATTQPWPEIRMTLDSLFDQARACGAEIIVSDRTGQGLPSDVADRYPGLIWLKQRTGSVFALRGAALARATGDLVATTEDHCRVAPDWCANILRAHVDHPDAEVFGGPIDNGYPEMLKDWAHHFLVFGPAVPPIGARRREPIWNAANLTYRRSVLPSRISEQGIVEMFFIRELQAAGATLLADPSIVVSHCQSFPFLVCCRYHFHNGRMIAAARLPSLGPVGRLARLVGCGILPLYVAGIRFSQVWPKRPHRRSLVLGLPWLAAFCVAHSCGEFIGYLIGGGSSPERLR